MSGVQRHGTEYDSYSPVSGWQRSTFSNGTDPAYVGREDQPVSSRSLNDITGRPSNNGRLGNGVPADWPYSVDPWSKQTGGGHLGLTPQSKMDGRYQADPKNGDPIKNGPPSDNSEEIADDDDTNPNRTFSNILTRFAERTSCIGPSYINSSNHLLSKGFWTMLFLGMTAATIWNVTENIITYYSWPTKTTVAIGYEALPFPTVTVCNTNPVRVSGLHLGSPDLREFISYLDPKSFKRPVKPQNNGKPPTQSSVVGRGKRFVDDRQRKEKFNKTFGPPKLDFGEKLGGDAAPQFQTESEFQYLIGSENSTTRFKMGHHIDEMLLSCSFEGRSCEAGNFTSFLSEEYGNCFSFNQLDYSKRRVAVRKSFRRGSAYGLQLMMFLEVDEYMPGLTQGYGVRVSVSHPETMAFPGTDGMFVSAGMETDIGMRLLNITRMIPPYGTCRGDSKFKKEYGFRYNRQACQAVCPHSRILEHCNCYDGSVERLYPMDTVDNYDRCSNDTDYECISDVKFEVYTKGNLSCGCPNPCAESVYDTLISSREWPEDGYMNELIDAVCRSSSSGTCDELLRKAEDKQRRNFLKLNVFYRDLNYETLTQEEDYTDAQFASDLGGSVGLWLGLSVLSMFEVIGLVVEIFVWLCRRCMKSSSKGNPKRKQPDQFKKTPNGLDMRHHNDPKMNGYHQPRAISNHGNSAYRQNGPYL